MAIISSKKGMLPRDEKNYHQAIRVICIISIYLFFFLSPWIFSNANDYRLTPIGVEQSLPSNRSVTINAWTYSSAQRTMEVQLGFTNNNYDGDNIYSFSALANGLNITNLAVDVVVHSDDLYVIHIKNIPSNYSQVRLSVSLSSNPAISTNLYSNKRDITPVSHIEQKSEKEYRIESLERKISNYENTIAELNETIEASTTRIENMRIEIAELESSKQYQTAAQISKTDSTILQKENEISSEQGNIEAAHAEISEYTARIELVNREIDDLRKEK